MTGLQGKYANGTAGIKLPIYEAMLVRRGAADIGLTKSAYGANLISRGLEAVAIDRAPALIDKLRVEMDRLGQVTNDFMAAAESAKSSGSNDADLQLLAFMIEVLLILRYLVKDDLRLAGEISRKLQRAVGDVRVQGT